MNANVVQVLPDGHLALPEQMKEAFADVKTFWAESRDEFIVLMPLERVGEEHLSAREALEEMQQRVARVSGRFANESGRRSIAPEMSVNMTDKCMEPERKTLPAWYTPITEELLQEITQRIVDALCPEKIILFGSNAYGEPTWDSDVDLLVVTNALQHESVFERHRAVSALFPYRRFAMDVLVRTPLELRQQLERGNSLFREILTRGKVLYERGDSGVDTQSRGRL